MNVCTITLGKWIQWSGHLKCTNRYRYPDKPNANRKPSKVHNASVRQSICQARYVVHFRRFCGSASENMRRGFSLDDRRTLTDQSETTLYHYLLYNLLCAT